MGVGNFSEYDTPVRRRASALALLLGADAAVQFGSAAAALLIPRVGVWGVLVLRLTVSAALLLALCRPRLRGHTTGDWAVAGLLGLTLCAWNSCFYLAIRHMPLGPTVTLELLGPLALTLFGSRRAADPLWAVLALSGVFLLGKDGFSGLDPAGVAFALCAAVLWACYIQLSARTGQRFRRLDGLAVAMAVAAAASIPVSLVAGRVTLPEAGDAGLVVAVAVLSSVVPTASELIALRTIPPVVFSVLMSLAPPAAALAGLIVLGQSLTLLQWLAMALVVVACGGALLTPGPARGP
ncbi:EamA family transporter [Streptomyces sp. NPDC041068]|uniref:EamA family transporter n=1 Tax=Streptomyces sp. NPDC041068 TaxID=3155130 RepID=UPI0033C0E28A